MPVSLSVNIGRSRKNVDFYTKKDIDQILTMANISRVTGRGRNAKSGGVGGGGDGAGSTYMNTMFNRFYNSLKALGETTDDLDGTQTSVPAKLKGRAKSGMDYYVINEKARKFYTITVTTDIGPGTVDLPIQSQIISAPSESRIVEVPGQSQAKQTKLDEKQAELDTKTGELDANLNTLDNELNTLDGYLGNPTSQTNFFESIVTHQAWIDKLVANQGWFDNLITNNLFTDKLAVNDGFISNLVADTAWINEVTANHLNSDSANFAQAFITNLVTDSFFADEIVTNSAFIANLWTKNATIENLLEMGNSGLITNAAGDYLIDQDGIQFDLEYTSPALQAGLRWGIDDDVFIAPINHAPLVKTLIHQASIFIFRNTSGTELLRINQNDEFNILNGLKLKSERIKLPVYTDTQRNNLSSKEIGEIIFNSDDNRIQTWDGTGWIRYSTV